MDFKKHIPTIEKKIRYRFEDKSLLTQAFTRASFCNEKNRGGRENYMSNEVLEFFGDGVLSAAIISLFLKNKTERYEHGIKTDLSEGDFSAIRSKLSDKRNLSKSTAELGLQKFLILGEGDEKLGIANEPSVMEDLFESIIGAVYIDCGMNMSVVIDVVSAMLDTSVYLGEATVIQSHKNALQEWCANKNHRLPAPIYKTLSESGPDHKKTYERGCYIGERLLGVGRGKNLKLADAAAAEAALTLLKNEAKENSVPLDAPTRLRKLAASNKLPSPEWRDLGVAPASSLCSQEFIIECRAMGRIASAIGKSKQEARALAAEKILQELEREKVKKEAVPTRKKAESKASKKKSDATIASTHPAKPRKSKDLHASKKTLKPKKKPHWQAKIT